MQYFIVYLLFVFLGVFPADATVKLLIQFNHLCSDRD